MNQMELAKLSMKAEIYAYATTLWEIFSYGRNPHEHLHSKSRNQKSIFLKNCPLEIIDLIREGWDSEPDNRFSPQNIFSRLIMARDQITRSHNYNGVDVASINTESTTIASRHNGHGGSLSSIDTTDTEEILIKPGENCSIEGSESEVSSSHSTYTTLSQTSHSRSEISINDSLNNQILEQIDNLAYKIVLDDDEGEVILQGIIGEVSFNYFIFYSIIYLIIFFFF